jgi:hypothetical protein
MRRLAKCWDARLLDVPECAKVTVGLFVDQLHECMMIHSTGRDKPVRQPAGEFLRDLLVILRQAVSFERIRLQAEDLIPTGDRFSRAQGLDRRIELDARCKHKLVTLCSDRRNRAIARFLHEDFPAGIG